MPANRSGFGKKKAGSTQMILVVGSNGTAATIWAEDMKMMIAKLDAGKIWSGIPARSKRRACLVILIATGSRDKLSCIGHMIAAESNSLNFAFL